jgi:hypothetical protein
MASSCIPRPRDETTTIDSIVPVCIMTNKEMAAALTMIVVLRLMMNRLRPLSARLYCQFRASQERDKRPMGRLPTALAPDGLDRQSMEERIDYDDQEYALARSDAILLPTNGDEPCSSLFEGTNQASAHCRDDCQQNVGCKCIACNQPFSI